jgi:CubicO group peptidase (beta-lactamase class C family)
MKGIDHILSSLIEKGKTPAVEYLFFNTGTLLHHFRGGFADIRNDIPVQEATSFKAFSVTKTFTALAVLQLVEQGMVDLDKPVGEYLPGFPYNNQVTTRHLLTHTSGIPNPIPLRWIHLADEQGQFDRDVFFEGVFKKHHKARWKPNEKFGYSNLGYVLLGRLIEQCSGLGYEAYIREHIFKPLHLYPTDLEFFVAEPLLHAKGYQKIDLFYLFLGFFIDREKFMDKREGKWKPFKNNYVNGAPYGGLIGTATAFMRYLQDLLKEDSLLISREQKRALFTENKTNAGMPTGMCLSWFTGRLHGRQYFSHAGGGGGYYCEIRLYPDNGVGSVLMMNRTGTKDERYLDKLDKYLF